MLMTATNQDPVPVTSVFGWIVMMIRIGGSSFSWNQPWSVFKNGFGSLCSSSSDFWLGLERMHQMTSAATYRLRVELQKQDGQWMSAEYATFVVGDETTTKYRLNVDR